MIGTCSEPQFENLQEGWGLHREIVQFCGSRLSAQLWVSADTDVLAINDLRGVPKGLLSHQTVLGAHKEERGRETLELGL